MPTFTLGHISTEYTDNVRIARQATYNAWLEAMSWSHEGDGPELPDLEKFRSLAQAELTRRRGEARRPHLTDTYGQQLVYADKEHQARQHQADPSPDPADYPALYGDEAEALGLDAGEMANLIMGQAGFWRIMSDIIEGAVRVAGRGIASARTHKEILNILIDLDI